VNRNGYLSEAELLVALEKVSSGGRWARPVARPILVPARPKVCTGHVLYGYIYVHIQLTDARESRLWT